MIVSWFDEIFLELKAQKTQKMFFGRDPVKDASHPLPQPLMIKKLTVEKVSIFKYLGTVVDLTFTDNVDHIYKKAQQRLFLLRKLRSFNVSAEVLQLVYICLIDSVLSFNLESWYGNLSAKKQKATKQGWLGWSFLVSNNCRCVICVSFEKESCSDST